MIVVSIEEVIEMDLKLKEINSTPFKDILFVGKGSRRAGCIVIKLDEKRVAEFMEGEPLTNLITSGHWKDCVIK